MMITMSRGENAFACALPLQNVTISSLAKLFPGLILDWDLKAAYFWNFVGEGQINYTSGV